MFLAYVLFAETALGAAGKPKPPAAKPAAAAPAAAASPETKKAK
jgi:hypothetical protein